VGEEVKQSELDDEDLAPTPSEPPLHPIPAESDHTPPTLAPAGDPLPPLPTPTFTSSPVPLLPSNPPPPPQPLPKLSTARDQLFFNSAKQQPKSSSSAADYTLIFALLSFFLVVVLGVTITMFVWR